MTALLDPRRDHLVARQGGPHDAGAARRHGARRRDENGYQSDALEWQRERDICIYSFE
jgi:hypothetical protein